MYHSDKYGSMEINTKPADGYQKIHGHLIKDVKHDGHHTSSLVADGHLTKIPLDSI